MAGEDRVWGPFSSFTDRLSNWDNTAACVTEREFLMGALKTVVDDFTPEFNFSLLSVARAKAELEERLWPLLVIVSPTNGRVLGAVLLEMGGVRLLALNDCSCDR